MPQFVIIARDGNDENALERRMTARPFHLEGAKKLKENGQFILGGAMLDVNGNMTGSVMVMEFEDEAQLNEWKENEPYIKDGVWKDIEIMPFKIANV